MTGVKDVDDGGSEEQGIGESATALETPFAASRY